MSLHWHLMAIEDRDQIMDYIAAANPLAAAALDEDFEAHAHRAVLQPQLYRLGRVANTREIVVHPNYIMVYRISGSDVIILRVLHAAQQWPRFSHSAHQE